MSFTRKGKKRVVTSRRNKITKKRRNYNNRYRGGVTKKQVAGTGTGSGEEEFDDEKIENNGMERIITKDEQASSGKNIANQKYDEMRYLYNNGVPANHVKVLNHFYDTKETVLLAYSEYYNEKMNDKYKNDENEVRKDIENDICYNSNVYYYDDHYDPFYQQKFKEKMQNSASSIYDNLKKLNINVSTRLLINYDNDDSKLNMKDNGKVISDFNTYHIKLKEIYDEIRKKAETNIQKKYENTTRVLEHLDDEINKSIKEESITKIPPNIYYLKQLKMLRLPGNNISNELNGTNQIKPLSKLTNLKYLNLARNDLTNFSDFTVLTQLNVLILDDNYITDLSGIGLTDLSGNGLTNLSGIGLTDLIMLDVGFNLIQKIPESINKLSKLKRLNLHNNRIKGDVNVSGLTRLHKLNLYNNQITSISGLESLKELRTLELGCNLLSSFSPVGMTKLDYLSLSNCSFKEFPVGILGCSNLTYLCLGYNEIDVLPDNIWTSLPKIQHLKLNHNMLKSIPEGIENMKNMGSLKLNGNYLTSLPYNELSLLSTKSGRLMYLTIDDNKFSSKNADFLNFLTQIKRIAENNHNYVFRYQNNFANDILVNKYKDDTRKNHIKSIYLLEKVLESEQVKSNKPFLKTGQIVFGPNDYQKIISSIGVKVDKNIESSIKYLPFTRPYESEKEIINHILAIIQHFNKKFVIPSTRKTLAHSYTDLFIKQKLMRCKYTDYCVENCPAKITLDTDLLTVNIYQNALNELKSLEIEHSEINKNIIENGASHTRLIEKGRIENLIDNQHATIKKLKDDGANLINTEQKIDIKYLFSVSQQFYLIFDIIIRRYLIRYYMSVIYYLSGDKPLPSITNIPAYYFNIKQSVSSTGINTDNVNKLSIVGIVKNAFPSPDNVTKKFIEGEGYDVFTITRKQGDQNKYFPYLKFIYNTENYGINNELNNITITLLISNDEDDLANILKKIYTVAKELNVDYIVIQYELNSNIELFNNIQSIQNKSCKIDMTVYDQILNKGDHVLNRYHYYSDYNNRNNNNKDKDKEDVIENKDEGENEEKLLKAVEYFIRDKIKRIKDKDKLKSILQTVINQIGGRRVLRGGASNQMILRRLKKYIKKIGGDGEDEENEYYLEGSDSDSEYENNDNDNDNENESKDNENENESKDNISENESEINNKTQELFSNQIKIEKTFKKLLKNYTNTEKYKILFDDSNVFIKLKQIEESYKIMEMKLIDKNICNSFPLKFIKLLCDNSVLFFESDNVILDMKDKETQSFYEDMMKKRDNTNIMDNESNTNKKQRLIGGDNESEINRCIKQIEYLWEIANKINPTRQSFTDVSQDLIFNYNNIIIKLSGYK